MTTTEQAPGPAGTQTAAADPAGTVTHAHSRPDACSVLSEQAAISAFGTASEARFWVAVEQSGPWGRDAMTQSHLDAELGADLAAACQTAGGRLLLIRRPGLHADAHHRTSRRVLVATRLTGRPELLAGDVPEAADLLRLPFDALANGDLDAVRTALPALVPSPEPALLVCTNARRDVCCAVRGRPVALQAAAERPGQVWECSHTGGHRFAPTAVLLPHGQTWARLSTELAVSALDAAARGQLPSELLGPVHDRGRSAAHRTGPGRGVLRPPADRRGRPHRAVDRGRPRRRPAGARSVHGHPPRRPVLGRARDPHRGARRSPRLLRQGARAVLAVGLLARLTRDPVPVPAASRPPILGLRPVVRLSGRRR